MRPPWLFGLAAIVALGLGLLLIHRCADGGAMASGYRACECRGIEWVQYDRTAADGPRRTICLGLVASTACYRSRGGEVIAMARRCLARCAGSRTRRAGLAT